MVNGPYLYGAFLSRVRATAALVYEYNDLLVSSL